MQGVDINACTSEGKTALHLAVHGGSKAVATLLIEMGAEVNAQDKERRTPLHVACLNNQFEIVRCLLEEGGATTGLRDKGHKVPLHLASINGHTKVVNLLIQSKCSVEADSQAILQPLHLAVLGI